ncbi:MAG TPA: hypothetical protein VH117_00790 [Edaphobacter sp.]|nr:hypothetical protein [Edaphobacter sp.]
MNTLSSTSAIPERRHQGPPLLLLALIYVALMVVGATQLGKAYRVPHDTVEQAVAYVANFGGSIRIGSFCELSSAVLLGLFVAVTVSRLRFLGVRAAGELIALSGGVGATIMLMLSALAGWSVTRPGIAGADGGVSILQAVSFAGGGPGFVVPLGLFIAGVSITAGLYRFIPRWLMWLGVVVAVACELATLTLLVWNAAFFIPVGRFIGAIWMICVALTLPTSAVAERDRI